jgi:phage-related protein (TIGR01555 family)
MKLFAKLWRRVFPKAPTTTVAAVLDTLDKGWAGVNWQRAVNVLSAKDEAPRVDYKLPERLPGVWPAKLPTKETGLVLAMDSGYEEPLAMDNAAIPAAWGFGAGLQNGPGLAFLGFPFLAELEQITEYRTPAEALANEMTRRWVRLVNEGKDDGKKEKITEIEKRMRELNVQEHFRVCAQKTEWFGRAHLAINIKGQDDDAKRQLPLDKIAKGTLLGFQPIEPYWMTPYSWNATHPSRPDFYKPQSWFELGKKTHHTRYCTFIFREVPDLLKPAYDFSGISITQLMMPYVNRWLRTAKNVNDLINIFSIVTLHTDLQSLLQDPEKFMKRLSVFTQTRDNRGLLAVQKDKEDLKTNNVPLSSLDKLQAQAQEHMATPARMTLIDFFGITPAGLNASAEPEMKARNKYVSGMQTVGFKAHVKRVLDLIQMDLYGEVDEEIGFEFVSLEEPTGKDLADIRKANTERDKMLIEANVVSTDEVRDNLRNDPEGGYTNLEGDAPEPPSVPGFDPETGAPLPEFGAEPGEGKPPKAKEGNDE